MADSDSPAPVTTPKSSLFRARALEAIDAREGLDELMTIVPPRTLFALLAIVAMLAVALVWGIFGRVPIVERGTGVLSSGSGRSLVAASADGTLEGDPLPVGTAVRRGTVIVRERTAALESTPLRAPADGTIVDVRARAAATVKRGDTIVAIEPAAATLRIVGFVDYRAEPAVTTGMSARVTALDDSGVAHPASRGHVIAAAPEPASAERVGSVLGNAGLAQNVRATSREVTIALDEAAAGAAGSPYAIVLVVGEVSPLEFLFPRER